MSNFNIKMVLDQWGAFSGGGAVGVTLDLRIELKVPIPPGCTHELDR